MIIQVHNVIIIVCVLLFVSKLYPFMVVMQQPRLGQAEAVTTRRPAVITTFSCHELALFILDEVYNICRMYTMDGGC